MKYLTHISFFSVPQTQFVALNLNQFFLVRKKKIPSVKDPQYIDSELKKLRFNTYGGYGENRKDVWKGTYLDEKKNYIHLGVDVNVKKGTELICPFPLEVIDVFTDIDTKMGWGGRVILRRKRNSPFIVIAHLNPRDLCDKKNLKLGEKIGSVGTWPENGNTFEHFHLQLTYETDFNTMDGYGYEDDLKNNPCPFTTEI